MCFFLRNDRTSGGWYCNHHYASLNGFCGIHLCDETESYCLQCRQKLLLMPTLCIILYITQNIFDSWLRAQKKSECQREDNGKNNGFNISFIHKINMLMRFDSPIVSKTVCVSDIFGF